MTYAVHMAHCNMGDYEGSCKYGDKDCPAMHPTPELLEFLEKGEAAQLHEKGYICISNKYRIIGRVDRDDWLMVLAKQMNCSPANYYRLDGSGIDPQWKEHYIRVHTEDTLAVSEGVFSRLKKMRYR